VGYHPVRSGETFVELTYQYQVKPWLQLQPDLQYVFNPGAGLANPNDPTQRINNELVLGVRANILF
jgi:porin